MDTILVFRMRRYDSWHVKIDALNAAAEKHGCRLQVIDQPATESAVRKLLDFWHPSGVIVVETPERKRPFPRELFGRTPTVFLDCEPDFATPGLPCLLHNTHAICADAIRELLDIGCTDIAYVGWYDRAYWCEDKRRDCREILELHGKDYREFIPTAREGRNAALLGQRLRAWIGRLPRPCGILAVNDTIAEQVFAAAAACGIAIPADLAVLGVDNDRSIGERMSPTLSSFTLDYAAVAEATIGQLAKPSRARTSRSILVKSFKLIRRQSTRRFKRKDADAEAAVELIRREACRGLKPAKVFKSFTCSLRLAQMRFKTLTGHSVQDEILDIRFQRLFELLADPHLPIGSLAERCGFPSNLVLRRQFKARTGLTPGEWRAKFRTSAGA